MKNNNEMNLIHKNCKIQYVFTDNSIIINSEKIEKSKKFDEQTSKEVKYLVSKNLNRIMDKKCITLRWLADKTNTTFQAISSYKTGKVTPSVGILYKIAKILNINMNEFFI